MLIETFKEFSCFSGLKPNITKWKIVGLGFKTVDFINETIKLLGIHFSCHNETKTEWNFISTVKKYRRLSIYGIQEHLL